MQVKHFICRYNESHRAQGATSSITLADDVSFSVTALPDGKRGSHAVSGLGSGTWGPEIEGTAQPRDNCETKIQKYLSSIINLQRLVSYLNQ